jgi:hypothetical protein
MAANVWLNIPRAAREDAKLTVARTGDLYGCALTLFVKLVGTGAPAFIPDAQGASYTDFIHSPDVRTVPGAQLGSADTIYLDVIVSIAQPAKLAGKIDFKATLEIPRQPASTTDLSVTLKSGDSAALADLSWEIDP